MMRALAAIIVLAPSLAQAQQQELSQPTHHPSPLGIYDRLRTTGDTTLGAGLGIGPAAIESNSTVHIASAAPAVRLDVVGLGAFDLMLYREGPWTGFSIFDPAANTHRFAVTAQGVGIGTNQPQHPLSIIGERALELRGDWATEVVVRTNDPTVTKWEIGTHNAVMAAHTMGGGARQSFHILDGKMAFGEVPDIYYIPVEPFEIWVANARVGWIDAAGVRHPVSSRKFKDEIIPLTVDEARTALNGLVPVAFRYKLDPAHRIPGFIAEDMPELLAADDHESVQMLDITAVVTKMVQEHQREIDELVLRLRKPAVE